MAKNYDNTINEIFWGHQRIFEEHSGQNVVRENKMLSLRTLL